MESYQKLHDRCSWRHTRLSFEGGQERHDEGFEGQQQMEIRRMLLWTGAVGATVEHATMHATPGVGELSAEELRLKYA